jgi:hypothetical protein
MILEERREEGPPLQIVSHSPTCQRLVVIPDLNLYFSCKGDIGLI